MVKRAAIIGAGFGGLALAIRLQAAGIPTTLFEGRDKPGGRAYVYREKGYTFDAGPTVVTDPTAIAALFDLAGRSMRDYVDLRPVTPFYRLTWRDGSRFDYVGDQEGLEHNIVALSPHDLPGYRHLHAYSVKTFREGYVRLAAVPFLRLRSMLAAAPQLMKLRAWRSVYAVVASYIRDERLRQAFSFHTLLVGGNPFATSSIYTLIHALEREWGVHFPMGGTNALVSGLARLFTDLGGQIRLSSPVEEIVVADGRATGLRVNGRVEPFDYVASNADIVHTYAKLLGKTARGAGEARRLTRRRYSMSLFVVHFGVRKTYPGLPHHNVLFGPRYRGLVSDIFRGPSLPEDFSLYLHNPCATDPSLAPEGCSAFYALSPVPHLGKAAIDWAVEGPRYRDRILAYLDANHLPGLLENLDTVRIFTPDDFASELNAHLGSAFSLEPVLWQSAYFRTHNRDDAIANLYFVGAGTHPGAGIPGVIASAKATAGLMLDDAGRGKPAD